MSVSQRQSVAVLIDEFHSESWSVSAQRAREIQPEDPQNASYQIAADALEARDFTLRRNLCGPITAAALENTAVLVLLHPCDPHWEHTTSANSPVFAPEEITAILEFVRGGGGLLVVTEYEHDKYGDNLNELLAPAGLQIANGKVFDRLHCLHDNPEWVLSEAAENSPLGFLVRRAGFYRAGWCELLPNAPAQASIAWQTTCSAHPPHAGLIALARLGGGRIAVVNDSNLFGDERIGQLDHLQLWLNLCYWLATPRFALEGQPNDAAHQAPSAQQLLIERVNELRALQHPDGSVDPALHATATELVDAIRSTLELLAPAFPHQSEYFQSLHSDLLSWCADGFLKPDFGASLAAIHPEEHRSDGIDHLMLFPMYTPNASKDIRFEAVFMRTPWPDWLAALERSTYHNPKFVPGHMLAYTRGYESDCAVLFPETVSVKARASNHFGIIFCDREAGRLQRYALKAARFTGLTLHPELGCLLASRPMLLDTLALWDLIHDASHSLGELPFDPFMIRQRAPFWMYGLEELRVDLRSFEEAARLAAGGFHFARYVCWAIILDRLFRFPISGPRLRNYDAFGGQLLFAYLHQTDHIVWCDNRLTICWETLPQGIHALREELLKLYKLGTDCSKMALWVTAHDFASRYLRPNIASKWKADSRVITDEHDTKKWIDLVHDDEFPLGSFHLNLLKQIEKSS